MHFEENHPEPVGMVRYRLWAHFLAIVVLLASTGVSPACEIDFPAKSGVDQKDELAKDLAFKFRQHIGNHFSTNPGEIERVNEPFYNRSQYPEAQLTHFTGQKMRVGNVAVILLLKDGTPRTAIYAHSKVAGFGYSHISTTDVGNNLGYTKHSYAHPELFPAWVKDRGRNSVNETHSEPIAIDLFYQHIDQLGGGEQGWIEFFDRYDDMRMFSERPPCPTYCANLVGELRSELMDKAMQAPANRFKFGVSHNYDTHAHHLSTSDAQTDFNRLQGGWRWQNQSSSNPGSGLTRVNTQFNGYFLP